jgi:hypothetical protein
MQGRIHLSGKLWRLPHLPATTACLYLGLNSAASAINLEKEGKVAGSTCAKHIDNKLSLLSRHNVLGLLPGLLLLS